MATIVNIIPYRILPAVFGGQKAVYYFNEYLGQYVTLYCWMTDDNQLDAVSCSFQPVLRLGTSKWRYVNPFLFFKIKKYIRQHHATHVMTEHPYFGWLVWALCRMTGCKMLVHTHNIESQRFKSLHKWWWPLMFRYEKWVLQQADLVFFITQEDRAWAEQHYGLPSGRTMVATYGIEAAQSPDHAEKLSAKKQLCKLYSLDPDIPVLLFNGVFSYAPNRSALELLIRDIIPQLVAAGIPFHLLVCGKDIPEDLLQTADRHISFAGFVPDIRLYFLGCDLFLNPIIDGGGIKTKLVEALSCNTAAVSFASGAIGVPEYITNGQLTVVPDADSAAFVQKIIAVLQSPKSTTGTAFYDHFNWQKIAANVAARLSVMG